MFSLIYISHCVSITFLKSLGKFLCEKTALIHLLPSFPSFNGAQLRIQMIVRAELAV